MRIRDVLKVKEQYLPRGARSVAADQTVRTAVPVEMPNRIVGRQEPLGLRDIFAVGDANDGLTGELPPALDLSRIIVPKTPHTRDLDYIKTQIARLPTQLNSNPSVEIPAASKPNSWLLRWGLRHKSRPAMPSE